MPFALFAALLGSLAIHAAALFGTDAELFGGEPEATVPLRAELRPLPEPPPEIVPAPPIKPAARPAKTPKLAIAAPAPHAVPIAPETEPEPAPENAPEMPSTATRPPAEPAKPVLPATGTIRFAIYKESLGLQIGRAEHRWEFAEDGSYRLIGITETSGLAALFKPVRLQTESRGRMVAGGMQPDSYRTLKNGKDANENADFDWATGAVTLSRDGSVRPIAPGT